MDENKLPEEEKPVAASRPAWQRWAAGIGVIVIVLAFLLYCFHIANGGA